LLRRPPHENGKEIISFDRGKAAKPSEVQQPLNEKGDLNYFKEAIPKNKGAQHYFPILD